MLRDSVLGIWSMQQQWINGLVFLTEELDMNSEINQRKKRSQGKKTSRKPGEGEVEGTGGGTEKISNTTTTREAINNEDNSINATTKGLRTTSINPSANEDTVSVAPWQAKGITAFTGLLVNIPLFYPPVLEIFYVN